jgi:hypothetical protein
VELHADRIADLAGRPLSELTRRDVAVTLLRVSPADALASLPGIRRAMLAAGNPLSAAFWESAEAILQKIGDTSATFGDVHGWLEATGTEPTGIIGLHVWDEQSERSPLQEEMHARLVMHLEEQLAAGHIDPDQLAQGDPDARQEYLATQERWMTSPLPDGRVPMTVLLDEQDEQFIADWEAADREAGDALSKVVRQTGERPLPHDQLSQACARLRTEMESQGWYGRMVTAFSGLAPDTIPADDTELWLTVAAGVASPQGEPTEVGDDGEALNDLDEYHEFDDEPDGDDIDETSSAMAAVCALDHYDWLAVMSALVSRGPGTPASASDLASYVRHFNPDTTDGEGPGDASDEDVFGLDDEEDDDEFDFEGLDDELSIEGLFVHVTTLWSVLGAIDSDERLTELGWWGLPEAMQRVWSS